MDTQLVRGESCTSSHISYEVFLSFRGEDTRKTFTGHLYSKLSDVGVNTFIDDEELRKGDVISSKLEKAIEESRISIIVFSRNYASSSWCLNELVKILECKEKLKQMVLPIFYDVDPSEVRKQTGLFDEALAKHKERPFGGQMVEKWRAALTEAANLSGWHLQNVAGGHESKFIETIIQQVLQEVNQTPLDVAWHPVAVDSSVKDIELLLQIECEDEVRMIGIHGLGGIGKTTLAKAMYNRMFRLFDSGCFLSDVRSEDEEFGLVKLQEKLLQQVLKTKDIKVGSVAQGVNLIKARLGSKKVLIVLDDVDHKRQLEALTRERSWFGSGSLIIITTRDKRLLRRLGEKERYEAKLLTDNEAMSLFCWHAFDNHFPPEDYVKLVHGIIEYSGRLPLALVTLGSHLQGSLAEEWGYEFEKLRAIPHSDIQKILKISFDGLDDEAQSVFLDIACTFHGFDEHQVNEILNACGFHTRSAIATLVQKHLLRRSWNHLLVMHDLVRDMGREIVRMESPRDPGKRSRLFIPQEVCDVLQGNKGSENVEVLKVDRETLKGVHLSTKAFEQMKNLRVLITNELHISGDFGMLSKKLKWLSWRKCPLKCIPSNFPAENLVVLDMRKSDIQEFQLNLQCCRSLKKLNLSYCEQLRMTPNFNDSRSLETLLLGGCSSLTEIHPSIGNLDRLIKLDMSRCEKLRDLPSSVCQLKSLEELFINDCSSIKILPDNLGDVKSLRSLKAYGTGIKQLPRSVEMLRNLETLSAGGQELEAKRNIPGRGVHRIQYSLPTFVTELSLIYWNLSYADIPRDIGSLSSLKFLDLSGNSFHSLPFDFSKLRVLKKLYLNDCENLHTLPSVSNLENLGHLELQNCKKLVKITQLDNLPSIRLINTSNCSSLQNPFNEGFAALLIPFRGHMGYLETYLECNEFPEWCSNQVTASSICFTMPTHNNEYNFLGMVLWFVVDALDVALSIAHKVPSGIPWSHIGILNGHRELTCVYYISILNELFYGRMIKGRERIDVWSEDITLKKIGIDLLYLDQNGKVISLPGDVDHSYSRAIDVRNWQVEIFDGQTIDMSITYFNLSEDDIPKNIGSLSSLEYLDLSGSSFYCLPFDISKLRLLKVLCLNDCENLQTLPSVSNLEYLERIGLYNCQKLVKISELDNLPSIWSINMINCSSLQNPFNEGFFSAPALYASRKDPELDPLEIFLECKEIPEWCRNQVTASSMCLTMPTHNNDEYNFLGMVLWSVFDSWHESFFLISIAGRKTLISPRSIPDGGHRELSCVYYISYLNEAFDGQMIKGGEMVEVWAPDFTVKKIGIDLLYVDQNGKVISLPGDMDHSYSRAKDVRIEVRIRNWREELLSLADTIREI
uniref:Disease resistance protein TAO1-like n=1 Tax=Nicotiana tabacum TaxID=4097 RepID=A0A1S4D645_TOBAC|nr:PREDICTED: disease resistance protein TAO1-like [Nicotiana tabacum]